MDEWNTLLGRFKYVLNWVNSFRPNLLGFRVWLAQCSQSLGEGYPISCPRWLAGREQEEREKVEEGGAGARRWEVRQRALILPFPCVQAVEAWSLLCPPGKEVPRRESELFLDLVSHKQRSWVSLNTSHMAVPHNKKLNCISVHSPRKDGFKPVQWDTVSRRWRTCSDKCVAPSMCGEVNAERRAPRGLRIWLLFSCHGLCFSFLQGPQREESFLIVMHSPPPPRYWLESKYQKTNALIHFLL